MYLYIYIYIYIYNIYINIYLYIYLYSYACKNGYFTVILIRISLMTSDSEHLMYLLAICMSSE